MPADYHLCRNRRQIRLRVHWIPLYLCPIAYVVQEMTVRLGAITKRGHAEAIFDAFGSFWGWFSLSDLLLTDLLTTITEFIGMTAAASIFGIPPLITVPIVIMFIMASEFVGALLDMGKDRIVFVSIQFGLCTCGLYGAS